MNRTFYFQSTYNSRRPHPCLRRNAIPADKCSLIVLRPYKGDKSGAGL